MKKLSWKDYYFDPYNFYTDYYDYNYYTNKYTTGGEFYIIVEVL